MTERLELRLALGLVAIALALRVGFALTVPVFQAPDERAHFGYVRFLLEEGQLPVQPPPTSFRSFSDFQSYQPPLAYLLYVPTAAASQAWSAGPRATLRALRIQNAIFGALLVAITYGVVRRLRPPGDPLRLLAPAVAALLPGLIANTGSLNNDGLASLLAASLWLGWLAPPGRRRSVSLGVLFGAACLAKLTAAALAPLLLLVPWIQGRRLRGALSEAALAACVALGVLLPWMLRNVAVYGHPLALDAGSIAFADLPGLLPPEVIRDAAVPAPGKALLQFFGRFGITNNLSWLWVPAFWGPLAALGALGWLRRDPRGQPADPASASTCLALAILLAAVGLAYFSLRYYGGWQGRYLYTCAAPVAILLGEGLIRTLAGGRTHRWVAGVIAALMLLDVVLLWRLGAFFAEVERASWGLRTAL